MALTLMYITNQLPVALIAQKYGVERIWIDLETLGKEQRQPGLNTVKSHHQISDIAAIAPHLTTSRLLVRINPWNPASKQEIDDVIAAGAHFIMLPYWKTPDEVRQFIAAVGGHCKTVLLLETRQAQACLSEVLTIAGIDEIHIGLNDLHLSYGLDFMFELLTNGTVEKICRQLAAHNIPFGFGGIARIGEGDVPAEQIVLEHYRLGSTRAILSRSFCNCEKITDLAALETIFSQQLKKLRDFEFFAATADETVFAQNRQTLAASVANVVQKIRARKQGGRPW